MITSILLIIGIIAVIYEPDDFGIFIFFYVIYTAEYCLCPMLKYINNDHKTTK